MATINYSGNAYNGEVLEDLLAYTAQGNDTYREGLIHIKPGVQKKFTLPHISLGEIIQDNVATPSAGGATSKGKYTISERYLEPQDFMVYVEFNPRDFEDYWRPFQPEGPLVFRDLDPKVQAKLLRLLVDRKDEYIGDSIWCSRKGGVGSGITSPAHATQLGGSGAAGDMKYFDGFLARVLANVASGASANEKATGEVVVAGNTEFKKGEDVENALKAMWLKCPKNVRKSKDLKFVMGWEAWDLYEQYLSSKDYKYATNEDVNRMRYKGKEIVVINGIPEHTIALSKFTNDINSNLWMGVDFATDQDSVKIDRLQANSELYFFQMRMKADVNIVRPSEIVVWTAYQNS